ncbi:MAG: heme biosynthesis HemY N-terminal domain-containing protein, partial [Pseudomonadota bacterium]
DAPSGAVLIVLSIFCALLIFGTVVVFGPSRVPSAIKRQRGERRRAKGMVALTRGLEAVAAGDAADAQRHARLAMKQLEEPSITRLLTAQAAQLAGDEETAQASFAAMLEAPETEFLGLRGLYLQAMSSGDRKEARGFAERAFRLRPGAEWAYQSVYALNIDRGAWGDARHALLLAQQNNLEAGDPAHRKEAALLTAQAYGAFTAEDKETALKDAELALKKSPGFAPAAVLAAQIEGTAGRRSKAGRLLDDAWSVAPHPAIAKTMSDLYAEEKVERRAARLKRLAERAPDADESRLLIAEQDIALGQFEDARAALEPLLTRTPRASTFKAMAAAMSGLHGQEAGQVWLDRAAAAPLDPVPGADGIFNFTTDGWQRLIREFGDHGRMAPPPLEEIRTHLSVDEIKLLTAPPPKLEPDLDDGAVDDTKEVILPSEPANDETGAVDTDDVSDPQPDESVDEHKGEGDKRTSSDTEKSVN